VRLIRCITFVFLSLFKQNKTRFNQGRTVAIIEMGYLHRFMPSHYVGNRNRKSNDDETLLSIKLKRTRIQIITVAHPHTHTIVVMDFDGRGREHVTGQSLVWLSFVELAQTTRPSFSVVKPPSTSVHLIPSLHTAKLSEPVISH